MLGALKRRWRTTKRSVSADNQYEVERDGLNEIIATPRYLEFLKNYREETAATTEALAASSPRYIEVRKGRIVLESQQQQQQQQQQLQPTLPARYGPHGLGTNGPGDCDKTDHLPPPPPHHHHHHHHGHRDSVLRIVANQQRTQDAGPDSDSLPRYRASLEHPPSIGKDRPAPRSPVDHVVLPPLPPIPVHQNRTDGNEDDAGDGGDDGGDGDGDSTPTESTVDEGGGNSTVPASPLRDCGKLVRNTSGLVMDSCKNTEMLEARIAELEEALLKLQERVNQSQCSSPTLEKEIKDHLEVMSKAIKTKDRKSMQVCREHKTLQVRFQKQENSLLALQNENKSLHQRVRQYESCLDDIMRKVVDALVAEDSLRDEVSILKGRVRDLEAQNAALVTASPAKSRDEGYCTMSSGQPQPAQEGHLAELPEEPEQWLVSAEPCTADMEDWSMSQEELATALDEENHEWIWNSSFLTTAETQTEDITALLHDQIVYSEDEEVTCTNFTRDFYRLVSFTSGSTRSLHSPLAPGVVTEGHEGHSQPTTEAKGDGGSSSSSSTVDATGDDSSDDNERLSQSPTPSEAGRAQVLSCSSSESSDALTEKLQLPPLPQGQSDDRGDDVVDRVVEPLKSTQTILAPRSLPQSPVRRFAMKKTTSGLSGPGGGSSNMSNSLSINTTDLLQDVLITCQNQLGKTGAGAAKREGNAMAGRLQDLSAASPSWRKSVGWRRVQRGNGAHETHIPVPIGAKDRLKSPPPVPIRRTFAS
ncbi:uncharacterized protein LOC126574001 isoform X2 [Anopheles aquasalis]|uniref:uncharacterized protein LOC126574001 isoform X2 n=1 Tax=Anopheles aquasalis TaxID=42839 RepID=UPI00215B3F9C|nr:uncharacterized protein LOC126574001 isoform X2 [Anopheles aquasalis]XP_050089843.1 uncharacterized protein LOC126574001 isoform X2 [Anopheles aquasalis]XP_050089844.1 uncharacterized protein LOC126574001 isoform X2 [Anopheles aquasalis]